MSRLGDLQGLLRGLEKVGANACRLTYTDINNILNNSYIKPVAQQAANIILDPQRKPVASVKHVPVEEMVQNIPLVLDNILTFSRLLAGDNSSHLAGSRQSGRQPAGHPSPAPAGGDVAGQASPRYREELDRSLSSLDLLQLDLTRPDLLRDRLYRRVKVVEPVQPIHSTVTTSTTTSTSSVPSTPTSTSSVASTPTSTSPVPSTPTSSTPSSATEVKLSSAARERSVPASRLSRVASFGGLGVGLGLGVAAEASRRLLGITSGSKGSGAKLEGSLILNEANAERIVATLCRVRGAALKLGQILSIQDNTILSPELAAIFDRVRESADFMPVWQLDRVLTAQLGSDWRQKFQEFDNRPFAAASIGQVHRARVAGGREVAVKVQYPGVAKSINSDISNLMSLLSVVAILPKGLFIENITKHMKIELAQECDYVREAECGRRMRGILEQYPEYYVPQVYSEVCTDQVLTTEYITGLTIDRCVDLPQETRNFIAESILKLVFRELFLHRYMQTDPNWANFLFNPDTNRIGLLDFGATREFRAGFVNTYFKIIDAAARDDREAVLEHSRQIGFLTGYESAIMNDAHVKSVQLLAVPFQEDKVFDFGRQTITHEIQDLSGVMLAHRLCPPPPEVYSLHRKLSGLFLLAGKLNSQFNCYTIWQDIRSKFQPF